MPLNFARQCNLLPNFMFKNNKNLIVPIITPRLNSNIDVEGLEKLINFLIINKVDAIFILGSTGEFSKIAPDEKIAIMRYSADIVKSKVPLLVGVSAESIDEMKMLIEESNKIKADAVVVMPLFGQGQIMDKMDILLEYSKAPIILYNNPSICNHQNFDISLVKKLSDHKKIIGIKDSSKDEKYFNQLLGLASPKFKVFQGNESLFLKFYRGNEAGLVASSANVYPKEFKHLLEKPRSQSVINMIASLKTGIKEISPNSILSLKTKLFRAGLIKSDELYG